MRQETIFLILLVVLLVAEIITVGYLVLYMKLAKMYEDMQTGTKRCFCCCLYTLATLYGSYLRLVKHRNAISQDDLNGEHLQKFARELEHQAKLWAEYEEDKDWVISQCSNDSEYAKEKLRKISEQEI